MLACSCAVGSGRATADRHGADRPRGAVPFGVQLNDQTVTYDVTGSTREEVLAAMVRAATAQRNEGSEGSGHFAYHTWHVDWRFETRDGPAGCRVWQPTLALTMSTRLPRWVDRDRAGPELIREWDAFAAALRGHEMGHADIALDAARDVRRALTRTVSGPCSAVGAAASRAAEEALRRARDRSRAYDVATHHGATQGASWTSGRETRVP